MFGGHDEEFAEEIEAALLCCYCERVMRDAMFIPSTRQGICSSCLKVKRNSKGDHTESSALPDSAYGTRIPECNPLNVSLDATEDPRLRLIINNLKVRCPNKGCKAQVLILKDFKNHQCGEEPSTRPRFPSIQSAPTILSSSRDCSATSGNAGITSTRPRKAPPQPRPRPQVSPSQKPNTTTSQYGKTKRDIHLQPTPATFSDAGKTGKQKFGGQSGLKGTASTDRNINTAGGEDEGAGKTPVREHYNILDKNYVFRQLHDQSKTKQILDTNLVRDLLGLSEEFVLNERLDQSVIDFAAKIESLQGTKDQETRLGITSNIAEMLRIFQEELHEQLQSEFISHSAHSMAMEELSTSLNNLSGKFDQQQQLLVSVALEVKEMQRRASEQQDINRQHKEAMEGLIHCIRTLGTPQPAPVQPAPAQPAPAQPAPVTMIFAESVQACQEGSAPSQEEGAPGSISTPVDEPAGEESYGEAPADQ